MIDTVDLRFGKTFAEDLIHLLGTLQVAADGLFHDDARERATGCLVLHQSCCLELLRTNTDKARRNSEIKNPVTRNAKLRLNLIEALLQCLVGSRVIKTARLIKQLAFIIRPVFLIRLLA